MPVPRGRKSRPTTASRTEDLPEDWDGVEEREERTGRESRFEREAG